jgi:glycosyltransferase involved in cell wall biosynthesis
MESPAPLPQVSIVTPVYNEAEYLADCIESVLAQTYQNWDYTIVDNCSTDGSIDIARRYAAKDRRIRIVENQYFLPAIRNHNVALRQLSPTSKYCKMVLGDDWIFPECLERMVAVAEEHPSVAIVGAYALEGRHVTWTGLPYPARLVSGREMCREHFLARQYVFGTATSVLYRADLVRSHEPFYNEANIHADTEVCFALLNACDFGFVHQVLSFTRVRQQSLSSRSADLHTDLAGMLQLLVKYGPQYLTPTEVETCLNEHLANYYRVLGTCVLRGRRDKEFWGYHKAKLSESGIGFSRTRIALGILSRLSSAALDPKRTIGRLWKGREGLVGDRVRSSSSDGQLFEIKENR